MFQKLGIQTHKQQQIRRWKSVGTEINLISLQQARSLAIYIRFHNFPSK